MLSKIVIRNYRIFRDFTLDFDPKMNILVGDNDAGKSTILDAIELGLTGKLRGRPLYQDLSPYLFHQDAVAEWIAALEVGRPVAPPEIIIDLFLETSSETAGLKGTNNLLKVDEPGVRVRVALNSDYEAEYKEFIKRPDKVRLIPTEYYKVEWLSFDGNGVTFRSIPATASLIDAATIHLQSGVDYYMRHILNDYLDADERVKLARAYRSLRETFAEDASIAKINGDLRGAPNDVSDRELTLNIDVSQKSSWESGIVPHLDDLPYQFVGKGEQSTLKILLALNKKVDDAHIVLVEEPENHLSFPNLGKLIRKISDKCKDRQVFITTHSSFVLNKLGLEKLVLLSSSAGVRLDRLPAGTQEYFRKLSGYDTLRLVLAKRSILVEGPSDELVIQRAHMDTHGGKLPAESGIDVINVRGLSFKRFLDIAMLLPQNIVAVVTDNDGNDARDVQQRYSRYTAQPNISVHVGEDATYKTLEPQLFKVNGLTDLNAVLGQSHRTDTALLDYMSKHKTDCALAIFESDQTITMPSYITEAIDAVS
ncbi:MULTISPECIES: ATP-dependent nuclease [Streptomyces]|uniref:ATP-dependent endonuclease n=1 Tax=Streptomyces dengpaensis TaxID=2049881 RepID=A0ABM6SM23_9ACTN|nr:MULTISPECIES: AAA family ATPase [Streptomyces]AVH55719.1 ATP-dependent endonuclease [Streptomyces dengpaensis]PIB11980.1 ATP-dependent endonuclease [Streptomyces sp. HG99]